MPRNGANPDGDGFTTETLQAYPILKGFRAPGDYTCDGHEMRKRFDVPKLDPEAFTQRKGAAVSGVYPDMLLHVEDPTAPGVPSTVNSPKASLTLVEAPKGSGKSTLIDQLSMYQMEMNNERIVRNGRQSSSDWRRMKDWATIWIPSSVTVDGRWLEATDRDDPTPEGLTRAVRYYDDVFELVEKLQAHPKGTYNVVYPDPLFRKCEAAMALADSTVKQPKFTPKTAENPTPATHWWFAFQAARVYNGIRVDEDGERNWMTAHIDEFGMFAPENAPGGEDGHYTYECIEIMADIAKESRSAGFSLIGYTHDEEDVASKWLKEFDYWVELANNERRNRIYKSEAPKPFREVPMDQDLLSNRPRGYGLCYNGSRFSEFQWTDLGYPHDTPEFVFRLGIPESVSVTTGSEELATDAIRLATGEDGQPSLLEEFTAAAGSVHQLRVLAPGSGMIDVTGEIPEVVEALESPYPEGEFLENPVEETDTGWNVHFTRSDGKEIVAAHIPKQGTVDSQTSREVTAGD